MGTEAQEQKQKRNRRTSIFKRKYLVNYEMQITFLAFAGIVAILAAAINLILMQVYLGFRQYSDDSGGLSWLAAGVLVLSFLLMSLLMYTGLIVSNRVAGPLLRMQRHMNEVASGARPQTIRLRETDSLKEFASSYNEVLSRLERAEQGWVNTANTGTD